MTNSAYVLSRFRRAMLLAPLIAAFALAGPACAQLIDGMSARDEQNSFDTRSAAERELEHSRSAVSAARAAAIAAKAELDAAVSKSRQQEKPGVAGQSPAAAGAKGKQPVTSKVAGVTQSEIETVKKLIADLQAERKELLGHLTTAHPLIIDADLRIEEYQEQLAALSRGRNGVAIKPPAAARDSVAAPVSPSGPQMADVPRDDGLNSPETAARLDEAFAKWEAAQQDLLTAMDAESAAAERLAALAVLRADREARDAETAALSVASETRTRAVSDTETATASDSRSASQPLVLAALIIALVIAAVASVKLARASDETLFAGADDAAATLALPVMGIIPAVGPSWAQRSIFDRYRPLAILGQMLLAVFIFALVAYCVQHPDILWSN